MESVSYSEALSIIEARPIMPEKPPSLEPMRQALLEMGFFDWPFYQKIFKADPKRVIVVAGTNGKGSTCATLEALFLSAGERVGLYTSPHLVETTERFRINGVDITRELFCQAFASVREIAKRLHLTHFEILTLMAVWIFCSGQALPAVDRLLLEVGLGGLWDATNAIPHGTAVITRIGHDHENLLGKSLQEIANNKFGIVTSDVELLVHTALPEGVQIPRSRDTLLQGKKHCAKVFPFFVEQNDGPEFFLKTPWGNAQFVLPGARGAENTALALQVFEKLGFTPEKHLDALKKVNWPGRMQRLNLETPGPLRIYLSGDHNPQGIESLIETLQYYPRRYLHVLVGIGKDKDCDKMLARLTGLPNTSVYLTETPFRGRKLEDYGEWLQKVDGAWEDPIEALKETLKQVLARAKCNETEDMVLVTGSLYLVGKILESFQSHQFDRLHLYSQVQ